MHREGGGGGAPLHPDGTGTSFKLEIPWLIEKTWRHHCGVE